VVVIKLSSSKYKALFQISSDVGQVVFASVVVPPLLPGFERNSWTAIVIVAGIITMLLFWYMSTIFAQKGKL